MAPEQPEPVAREAARGRSSRTPWLLLGSVAATVWSFAGLVTLIVLLLWWLL